MIVSFSVANFRSFDSEETFSLVASKRLGGSHEQHTLAIPDSDEKVLRTGVIYGANGAGKSNLFKALRYVKTSVISPAKSRAGTGRQAFRFGGDPKAPSIFDLQFIASDRLYRFCFKVNDHRVTEEWLSRVDGTKEKIIYERLTHENGQVLIKGSVLKSSRKKLVALATVGGPQNQTFLATVLATLDLPEPGVDLTNVLEWFLSSLKLIGPESSYRTLAHSLSEDPNLLEFAEGFLKCASTGIKHLNIHKTEVSQNELMDLVPEKLLSKMEEDFRKDSEGAALVHLGEGNDLLIERAAKQKNFRIRVEAAHEHQDGHDVPLELQEESDGTRRLIQLIPALHDIRTRSSAYFIDEIDRSLHPMLVRTFLDSFLKSCEDGQRQIIVTTHESCLLDQDLLRRDEIWFAEKDQSSATRLYSLVDFKIRSDLEIRKNYLQGRFGAIPFFGGIDNLIGEKQKAK